MFVRVPHPRFRIAVWVSLVAAGLVCGCSREQEELKLDPGASPFYPGPAADGKSAVDISRAATTVRTEDSRDVSRAGQPAPLNTTLGANAVERQLRLAQRAARDGDVAKATEMLDQVLAAEPINREALVQRAALALEAFKRQTVLTERLTAIAKAGELARTILRVNEAIKPQEIDIVGRVLYAEIEARMLEGRTDLALTALKTANDLGFNAVSRVEADQNMAALRASPQYKATIHAIDKATLAQSRERLGGALARPANFTFDFALADPDGKKVSLADFRGKVVLVDFWGTWCDPCRQSIPHLLALYKRHHPRGLEIVGLNYEKDAASDADARNLVKQAKEQIGIPYPCLMGDDQTRERVPGFSGFPTSLILDRTGKIRLVLVGYDEKSFQKIADAVLVLLSEPAPSAAEAKAKK
jgi:thiol-disulfide isomerase/thioredoxin